MTKRGRDWLVIWCAVVGTMAITLSSSLIAVDPKENLSPIQLWIITAAVLGNGAINLGMALKDIPAEPDQISTKEVRKILGVPPQKKK